MLIRAPRRRSTYECQSLVIYRHRYTTRLHSPVSTVTSREMKWRRSVFRLNTDPRMVMQKGLRMMPSAKGVRPCSIGKITHVCDFGPTVTRCSVQRRQSFFVDDIDLCVAIQERLQMSLCSEESAGMHLDDFSASQTRCFVQRRSSIIVLHVDRCTTVQQSLRIPIGFGQRERGVHLGDRAAADERR